MTTRQRRTPLRTSPLQSFFRILRLVPCLVSYLCLHADNLPPVSGLITTVHTYPRATHTTRVFKSTPKPEESVPLDSGDDGSDILRALTPHPTDVTRMSGTDLAYIGDCVFELFVRSRYVWPPRRTSILQTTVVECVRAENQSKLLSDLRESFPLSAAEQQVLSRGRNAVTRSRTKRDPATYQDSTAFEALVGYLYISDKKRCLDLFKWLDPRLEPS